VAGANVGLAIQPTPANCDGVTTPCTYPAGTFGELAGNVTGLLATQKNDTTAVQPGVGQRAPSSTSPASPVAERPAGAHART